MGDNGKRRSIPERSMVTSLLVDYLSHQDGFVSDGALSKVCGADVTEEARGNMTSARKAVRSEKGQWWKRVKGGYEPCTAKDAGPLARYGVDSMHRTAHRTVKRVEGCGDLSGLDNTERVHLNASLSAVAAIAQFTQSRTVKRLEAACQQKADKLLVGETLKQFGVE